MWYTRQRIRDYTIFHHKVLIGSNPVEGGGGIREGGGQIGPQFNVSGIADAGTFCKAKPVTMWCTR